MIFHVINLDRSPERWAFMAGHLAERGLETRRVPAVDGRGLGPAEVDRLAPAVPGRRRLAASEVACFESHKRAWAAIAEGPEPVAAVLEDDVWLAERAGEAIAAIAGVPGPDLVKLNNYEKPVYLYASPVAAVGGIALHRLAQRTIDASAYLVTRAAAAALLERHETYAEELDIELFDPASGLVAVQAVPALAVQEKFADFAFLDGPASESLLELTREEARRRRKAERGRMGPGAKLAAELRRFHRRRLQPRLEAVRNLGRPEADRIVQARVDFVGR